jgi:hypothetical protein
MTLSLGWKPISVGRAGGPAATGAGAAQRRWAGAARYFAVLKYRGSGGGWSLRVGIR